MGIDLRIYMWSIEHRSANIKSTIFKYNKPSIVSN